MEESPQVQGTPGPHGKTLSQKKKTKKTGLARCLGGERGIDVLGLLSRTHVMEGESQCLGLFSDLYMCILWRAHAHTVNKCKIYLKRYSQRNHLPVFILSTV